mmetsp:Transcript_103774/g.334588  ORF Transcript_103774/g.334588 Transcript_103774/m.334588 type:complete len:320 (+) Transcript_103774:165-1124(+)
MPVRTALEHAVEGEGGNVAQDGQDHHEGPDPARERLQAQADGEHDGGRLVEVPCEGRVRGRERLHQRVLQQVVARGAQAGEAHEGQGLRAELHDLLDDLPIGHRPGARPLNGVLHVEGHWQQGQSNRYRHVERGVQGVQLHVGAEGSRQDQVQGRGDVGQGAHGDPEEEVLGVGAAVRALALGHRREARADHAGGHQHDLDRPDLARHATEQLHQQRHQGQARADDEVQGDSQQRETEVVEADVHRKGHGENEDPHPLLGRLELLGPVGFAEVEPLFGCDPEDQQHQGQDDEGHDLLDGRDEERRGHALEPELLGDARM